MGHGQDQLRSTRRAVVGALGRSWIFWPALLFFGALAKGSGPWGATWVWAAVLLLVGPLLSLAIWTFARRGRERATPPSGVDRLLRHLRGTNTPT